MNQDNLIPELHDMFKLTIYRHDLTDFPAENFRDTIPNNRTWQGIIQHHAPVEPDTILLALADHLASSYSRTSAEPPGQPCFTWVKLWNTGDTVPDQRFRSDPDVRRLIHYTSICQSGTQFLQEYEQVLKARAEDARPGKNITSLYTHCLLTGKFYRLLSESSIAREIMKDFQGLSPEEISAKIKEGENKRWQLIVVRCRIHFPQKPFRAADLNIISVLDDILNQIEQKYPQHIYYSVENELICFFADETQEQTLWQELKKYGCWLELTRQRRPLNEVTAPRWLEWGDRRFANWDELPNSFQPPICQVCQMAKAVKHWPLDYILTHGFCDNCQHLLLQMPVRDAIPLLCEADREKIAPIADELSTEDLCESCYTIRTSGVKLHKLKEWTETGGTKVVWFRIGVNMDILIESLTKLHQKFQEKAGVPTNGRTVSIRFPLISEFQDEYRRFLNTFQSAIINRFDVGNVESVTKDLYCIRIHRNSDIFPLLDCYRQTCFMFFPELINGPLSPFIFAAVVTSPKYPFFEVWSELKEITSGVFVLLPDKGALRTTIENIEVLINLALNGQRFSKSALEKLARVAKISQELARITATARNEEYHRDYIQLLQFGLDFPSLLTLAKLMEG